MKPPASSLIALFFAVTLPNYAAETGDSNQLKYRFVRGQTNAYQVTLESTAPEESMKFSGVVFVDSGKVVDGVAAVRLSGGLKPEGSRGPATPFPDPYGFPPPLLRQPMGFPPIFEVRVDDRGQVLRAPGMAPALPAPLGSLAEVLFQPLPAPGETESQTTVELWIEDETPARDGSYGGRYSSSYYPGRSQALLAATRTAHVKFGETTAEAVTITKRIEAASRLKSGDVPRLRATAEGAAVFDRQRGCLRSVEFRCDSTITTETLTLRRPFVLSVRLLAGDELAKALKAESARTQPAPPISAEALAKLVADLEADDQVRRQAALASLQNAEIESPAPELLAAAVKLSGAADTFARNVAVRLLGKYGTAAQLPTMLSLLKYAEPGSRQELLAGLRRIGDPRAIMPLADLIARGSYEADTAAQILGHFGPAAEPAAVALLKEKHADTRRRACTALAAAGTEHCLDALKEQMLDPDSQVSQAATEAARAVRARCGGEGE